jgi:hypothetical protein
MKYLFLFAICFTLISCSDEDPEMDFRIWTGPKVQFDKEAGANPEDEINQDRISSSVWITRGNKGGQNFNILAEESATKEISPLKTRWALGDVSDVQTLTFSSFRAAVGSPKSVVGKDLVLHLEDENVYLSVKFTRWDEGQGGGFGYERSSFN